MRDGAGRTGLHAPPMDYVNLGRTGLRVSRLCLGVMTLGSTEWRPWVLGEEAGRPFIRRALDAGINFFDTADMYSRGISEEILGRALGDFTTREQVVIATKAFFPMGDGPNDRGLSRKHLFDAIDASLRRLGTDYVDLYQIHRFDPIRDRGDARGAPRHRARRQGPLPRAPRACTPGSSRRCSTWRSAAAGPASSRCRITTTWSTARRSARCCRSAAPRASGSSPGAPSRAASSPATGPRSGEAGGAKGGDTLPRADGRVRPGPLLRGVGLSRRRSGVEIAGRRGVTPARVALAWILRQPGVAAPIIGATKIGHLDDAVAALDLTLDDDECRRLEEPYVPAPGPRAPLTGTDLHRSPAARPPREPATESAGRPGQSARASRRSMPAS